MSSSVIYLGGDQMPTPQRDSLADTVPGKPRAHLPSPRRVRVCMKTATLVHDLPPMPEPLRPRRRAVKPVSDGSGVFWDITDRMSGYRMWRIEAKSYQSAVIEKKRLCRMSGGSPKHCKLEPAK